MPTLRSIGVDEQLCTKLASGEAPITTPLALLSRDAATTAHQLQVPLSIWQEVRLAVADALLIHSCARTAHIVGSTEEGEASSAEQSTEPPSQESLVVGSMTALEYWKYSQSLQYDAPPLTIGCKALNPWLCVCSNELQHAGGVIQFTGSHSSGKTQICLDMAVRYTASSQHSQVFYLTSTTPPPVLARRLRQLVVSSKLPREILARIELISLSTPYQLLAMLQKVKERVVEIPSSSSGARTTTTLLILDSASACLLGCRWDMTQQVTLQLKELLHLYGVAIVVTNGISSKGDAALGPTWNNETPHIHIRLRQHVVVVASTTSQDEEQEQQSQEQRVEQKVIRATLERHPHRAQLNTEPCDFCITAQGVKDGLER